MKNNNNFNQLRLLDDVINENLAYFDLGDVIIIYLEISDAYHERFNIKNELNELKDTEIDKEISGSVKKNVRVQLKAFFMSLIKEYGFSPILDALFKYFMINGSKQTPKIDHDKGGVGRQGKKKNTKAKKK